MNRRQAHRARQIGRSSDARFQRLEVGHLPGHRPRSREPEITGVAGEVAHPCPTPAQQQGWEDFYKSGDAAAAYFTSENERITTVLTDIGLG